MHHGNTLLYLFTKAHEQVFVWASRAEVPNIVDVDPKEAFAGEYLLSEITDRLAHEGYEVEKV